MSRIATSVFRIPSAPRKVKAQRSERSLGRDHDVVLPAVLDRVSGRPVPASVQGDVTALTAAAGSLPHPSLDLSAPAVQRAQTHIISVCQKERLTIGTLAQGG